MPAISPEQVYTEYSGKVMGYIRARIRSGADAEDLHSIHGRHADVREDQVERLLADALNGGGPVMFGDHLQPLVLEETVHQTQNSRFVIDDKYACHCFSCL